MKSQRRIGVMFHPNGNDDLSAFEGARDFILGRPDWTLIPFPSKSRMPDPNRLANRLDGLLMGGWMVHRVDHLPDLPIALWMRASEILPGSDPDYGETGARAAEHLMSLGLRAFLYVPALDIPYHGELGEGFQRGLEVRGLRAEVLREGPRVRRHGWNLQRQLSDWRDHFRRIRGPVGILAFDEVHGERVLEACHLAGLTVPEDVALIVASTNPTFCGICQPPISCVFNSTYDLGYAAAEVLRRVLDGETTGLHKRVPPSDVLARESTRTVFTDDETLGRAVEWMERHGPCDWSVEALAEAAHCSRMTLFRRFKEHFGCPPMQLIQRRRLELARERLVTGRDPIVNIALDCGFTDSPHFSRAFKKATGLSPGAYRNSFRTLKS